MKLTILTWTFVLLTLCNGNLSAQDAEPTKKKNVLMIVIDDQNDWIGCLGGHPLARTPAIDELASRGTLFADAHCQAPLCNPSRTSVMTGLRPTSTGIYALQPQHWDVPEFRDVVTLPQALHAAGYETACVGKIYHGVPSDKEVLQREFDIWGPGAAVGAKPAKRLIPDTPPHNHALMDWGTFDHKDEDKGDYKTTDWAIDYLSKQRSQEKPFFLSVGFFLPHVPCYVTPQWYDQFPETDALLPKVLADDRFDTPRFSWYLHWTLPEPRLAWLKQNNQWHNLCRSYLASTSFVDSQINRLLLALRAEGLEESTVIVLWSDHGYHLGEKEISGKNTLWEESTHVPLIFAGGGLKASQRCSTPVELLDIYPTLCDVLKIDKPQHLEGQSLSPQLEDPNASRESPVVTSHNRGNHAIRNETYRYIQYADGMEELYDVAVDPDEFYNLATLPQSRIIIERLKKSLPVNDRPMVTGSDQRTLQYDKETGVAIWEGTPINKDDEIPAQ